MKTRIVFGAIAMMLILTFAVNAGGKGELQKYFSNVASKVKATDNATQKREILNESFQSMSKALDIVENSGLISENDRVGINLFRTRLQDKQDELLGNNGYERVTDAQLNSFSIYVVQDMEQAELVSLALLVLIIVVIVLLLR